MNDWRSVLQVKDAYNQHIFVAVFYSSIQATEFSGLIFIRLYIPHSADKSKRKEKSSSQISMIQNHH